MGQLVATKSPTKIAQAFSLACTVVYGMCQKVTELKQKRLKCIFPQKYVILHVKETPSVISYAHQHSKLKVDNK